MPSLQSKRRPVCDSEHGFGTAGSHSGAPHSLQTQSRVAAADPGPSSLWPRPDPMVERRQFRVGVGGWGGSGDKRREQAEKRGVSVVPGYEGGRNGLIVPSGDI